MLSPTKVSGVNCFDRLGFIRSYDENYATGLTEQLKESFEASPDFVEVYKNYDFSNAYKTRIFEGNDADKKLGFKYLQSYPYDLPQFKIGDYIHWKFNHVDFSTWLLISLDTQHLYDVRGRMMLCNNYLKWIDENGKLQSYECVFQDSLTYASFKYGESGVVQVNGTIAVLVPQNNNTRKIYRDQRFIFDGIPYVVNNFIRSVNSNFLELYMFETQRLEQDDLVNNIAYNGIEENKKPTTSVTTIMPDVNDILEGTTEIFTVQRYINGVPQNDTYEISCSGVPTDNYLFALIDGHSFSIKNIHQYTKKPLTISCLNTITHEITTMDIWLVGGW